MVQWTLYPTAPLHTHQFGPDFYEKGPSQAVLSKLSWAFCISLGLSYSKHASLAFLHLLAQLFFIKLIYTSLLTNLSREI